ncbi:MAG: transcription elongation factor GreA [Phycisphaeraceae bacterium]|nr:transcription elongation factor GreA [Phycisphaeraceae bacterium]
MLNPEPMSRTGYNKLRAELDQLEKVELPEVQKTVADAREEGDLKENGAYIYGRQRQGHIVGRISELKGKLNRADIIDCTKVECDRAVFGTVVSLLDLDTQEKITYQLLGPDDADYETGSISIHSPIGRAIFGHSIGDKITVKIPRGDRNLEVLDIAKPEVD